MKRKRTLYALLVHRAWHQRTLRLCGDVEVLLEYDARMYVLDGATDARIRLNGVEVVVARRGELRARHQLLLPAIRYGVLPILEVEFAALSLTKFRFFRLTLDSEVLYEENRGTVVTLLQPPPLPIPTQTSPSDHASLPLCSDREIETT